MARILILVENLSVPFDRRVWQESRALTEAGHEVTVICPRGSKRDTEPYALIEGVEIHRYPLEAATGGPAGYLREYGTALWHTMRLAWQLDRERPFDVVQACNPPDLLFLVALPLKLRGARFVFDHHDLVPELFRSRFGAGGPLLRATELLEKATFRLADHVISTNESYRRVAQGRGGVAPARTTVVRSAPDLTRFVPVAPDDTLRRGRRHLVCYLGVMGPQDGVDYALRVARKPAATTSAATTSRPRSWATATPGTTSWRSRTSWGWTIASSSPAASRTRTSPAISRLQTSASRPTRRTRSTTSRR